MNITPCPHCYRKVIPMTDGTCPSCGKSTNDKAGTDPNRVLVEIRSGQRLPPVCHSCGIPTEATKLVSAVSQPQGMALSDGLGGLVGHFFKPLGLFHRMERDSKTVEVSVALPTCKQCARKLRHITPQYIDFDAHRVDLVVHVEFKKAIDQKVSA